MSAGRPEELTLEERCLPRVVTRLEMGEIFFEVEGRTRETR